MDIYIPFMDIYIYPFMDIVIINHLQPWKK